MHRGSVCLVWALVAAPASAQVRGLVRDDAGQPVAGALIQFRSPNGRSTFSGADGSFVLSSKTDADSVLLIRAIGFRPKVEDLTIAGSFRVITLTALAQTLPVLTARAEQRQCPEQDDLSARRFYLSAITRYDIGASERGTSSAALVQGGIVSRESLGSYTEGAGTRMFIAGGARDRSRRAEAFYGEHNDTFLPRFDQWQYPFLESIDAWHFVDSLFSRLNRMSWSSTDAAHPSIRFCSRRGRNPYVQGTLTFSPDTALVAASWQFVIPGSPDSAGGETVFAPRSSRSPGPLIPLTGLFWRQRVSSFYQEWMEFPEWFACHGVSGDCGDRSRRLNQR